MQSSFRKTAAQKNNIKTFTFATFHNINCKFCAEFCVKSRKKNNEKQLNVSQSRKSQSKMSSEAGPSGSVDRMAERKKKLAALHRKRNESRQLNHAEVVEEDRRSKEPKNMEVCSVKRFISIIGIIVVRDLSVLYRSVRERQLICWKKKSLRPSARLREKTGSGRG